MFKGCNVFQCHRKLFAKFSRNISDNGYSYLGKQCNKSDVYVDKIHCHFEAIKIVNYNIYYCETTTILKYTKLPIYIF